MPNNLKTVQVARMNPWPGVGYKIRPNISIHRDHQLHFWDCGLVSVGVTIDTPREDGAESARC